MVEDTRTSAIERLRELPVVFSGRELTLRYGWPSKQASQYLYRWRRKKLVKSLGGRSDIHFNLLLDPAWERHVKKALKLAYPSAVIIGRRPLYEAGWVSQHAYSYEIAVPDDAVQYDLEPIAQVHTRPEEWFRAIPRQRVKESDLPSLPASWAMADMQRFQDPPPPDTDDIYWDHMDVREAANYKTARERLAGIGAISQAATSRKPAAAYRA